MEEQRQRSEQPRAIRKVAAAILSSDSERLLVVRKKGRDVFILPGGTMEDGESPEETLRREIYEELGCEILALSFLLSATEVAVFENVPLELFVYSVTLGSVPTPRAEIEEILFVPADWQKTGLRYASGITKHVIPRLFGSVPEIESVATPQRNVSAVLFSGGRDSTAVALHLYDRGDDLRLLWFWSGLLSDHALRAYRVNELYRVLDAKRILHSEISDRGLVREICFKHIVSDIQEDGCQLLYLGEAIAMLVAAAKYCISNAIHRIAFGATAYQNNLPEQQPAVLELFREFLNKYGIQFLTPGDGWASEDEVKERLHIAGVSSKSLEGISLLADIDDYPSPEAAVAYARRKLKWASQHLDNWLLVRAM